MGAACSSKSAVTTATKATATDREAELRKCFQTLDKDRSGFIDMAELRLFLQKSGIAVEALEGKAKELLERLDANADKKVSIEEFVPTVYMLTSDKSDADFQSMADGVCNRAPTADKAGSLTRAILSDEAPVDAPVDAPVNAPVNAPAEEFTDAPVDAPAPDEENTVTTF